MDTSEHGFSFSYIEPKAMPVPFPPPSHLPLIGPGQGTCCVVYAEVTGEVVIKMVTLESDKGAKKNNHSLPLFCGPGKYIYFWDHRLDYFRWQAISSPQVINYLPLLWITHTHKNKI